MRLDEWVKSQGHGSIQRLAKSTKRHYTTVHKAVRCGAQSKRMAELLSEATVPPGGTEPLVSVAEALGLAPPAPEAAVSTPPTVSPAAPVE